MTREEFEKMMKSDKVKIVDKPVDYSKYAKKEEKAKKPAKKGKK